MRLPALLMTVVMVAVFGVGCAKIRPKPRPPSTPQPTTEEKKGQSAAAKSEDKDEKNIREIRKKNQERLKIKEQINNQLDRLENQILKKEQELATKRAQGFDVSSAEIIIKKSKNLWKEAEDLYLEANLTENYEPVSGLLNAIEESFKKINEEIKKAPRFREKTKVPPLEFADDRDQVIKLLGHPDRERTGPIGSINLRIFDPTPSLLASPCMTLVGFQIKYPPTIKIMEFNKDGIGRIEVVFWENNSQFSTFYPRTNLRPEDRDNSLSILCREMGQLGNYQLITAYVNKPVGSPEQYLEQLLTGHFTFADQFGFGSFEGQKVAGALADFELVSLVFNTKIIPLNKRQHELLERIVSIVKKNLDQIVTEQRGNILVFNQEKAEKIRQALANIVFWQSSLLPKKSDKKEILNLLGQNEELSKLLNDFEEEINKLEKEFNLIREKLLRFKRDYNELIFYDDESLSVSVLLLGVNFKVDDKSANTLFKKDVPQLKVDSELFFYRSKNDNDPLLVARGDITITEANKYIDVSKDFQRLTNFNLSLFSEKPLPVGNYRLRLEITDEIREEAIIHEVEFGILPASLKENQRK